MADTMTEGSLSAPQTTTTDDSLSQLNETTLKPLPYGSSSTVANNAANPLRLGSSMDLGRIRCICSNEEDDGFTIQCDQCYVWQHAGCVGITKSNVPDRYFCELCLPTGTLTGNVDVGGEVREMMMVMIKYLCGFAYLGICQTQSSKASIGRKYQQHCANNGDNFNYYNGNGD